MFSKKERNNIILCVFDPKLDHTTKIKKEYDSVLESYVYNLSTIADKININFLKSDEMQIEAPNYLITQLLLFQNKSFSMEIVFCEINNMKLKKKVVLATTATTNQNDKPNYYVLPLKQIKKNTWTNLCINITQIIESCFLCKNTHYIEQIIINSYAKLRKIVYSDTALLNNLNMQSPRQSFFNESKTRTHNENKLIYLKELLKTHSNIEFYNEYLTFANQESSKHQLENLEILGNKVKFQEEMNDNKKKITKKTENMDIHKEKLENNEFPQKNSTAKEKDKIVKKSIKTTKQKIEKNHEEKNEKLSRNEKNYRANTEISKKKSVVVKTSPDIKQIKLEKIEKFHTKPLQSFTQRPFTNENHIKHLPEQQNKFPRLNELRKTNTTTFSPERGNFQEMAKKFTSITINEEFKNETNIMESINANSIESSQKFDDGSIETVKSIVCNSNENKSINLLNKSTKNHENSSYDNEFLEKSYDKKEISFDKFKMFKNSSVITFKNNQNVIVERKDNHQNKGFINDIRNLEENRQNFIFDPVLKSFYDPMTQTYYHKI